MLCNKPGNYIRTLEAAIRFCSSITRRLCNTGVRICIRANAASISAFVSLETLLENKLNKARWPPNYQICHCNAI